MHVRLLLGLARRFCHGPAVSRQLNLSGAATKFRSHATRGSFTGRKEMVRCLKCIVLLSVAAMALGCAARPEPKTIPPTKTIEPDTSPGAHKAGNPGT